MAASTVSSTSINPWQLIATVTASGTSTTVITGLTGYKTLMLAYNGVYTNNAAYKILTFNGSATGYASQVHDGSNGDWANTGIILDAYSGVSGTGNISDGNIIINDILSAAPKTTAGTAISAGAGAGGYATGAWNNTAAITSIAFTTTGGTATFSAGTITLYGIAA